MKRLSEGARFLAGLTVLLVAFAGMSVPSTANVGSAAEPGAHSYDPPSTATTPPANARADAIHGERRSGRSSRLSSSSVGFVLATKAGRGGAGPVRVGQAGEDAVRRAYDIGPKVKVDVGGTKRIPDGLTDSTVSEVKNVGSLSYTRQIRDFEAYAQQSGRTFDLFVRPGARLSGPLRGADAAGRINIREIP